MFGGLTMVERVDLDFTRARRRAFVSRLARRFSGGDTARNFLLDFHEAKRMMGASRVRRLGRRTVEVSRIVGSVGRSGEFDREFMPRHGRMREVWERADRSFHRGEEFSPVILYSIGEDLFVSDGNHRVSVARFHGVEMMDAEITELRPLRDSTSGDAPRQGHAMVGEKG
jgi:hypothetical protein